MTYWQALHGAPGTQPHCCISTAARTAHRVQQSNELPQQRPLPCSTSQQGGSPQRTASVPTTPPMVAGTVGRPGVLASVVSPVKAASPPSTATAHRAAC